MNHDEQDHRDSRSARAEQAAQAEHKAPDNADHLIRLRDQGLLDQPVELVAVERLSVDFSPRLDGEDEDYAQQLADAAVELPPILVHRPTMTVVDGAHRLRAARLRGTDRIAARFFEGNLTDARLLAVATNIVHGRPLSNEDRAAAARRVFASHPHWSDRAVGSVTGLSAKKVAQLRGGGPEEPGARRIGRDGRSRPLDSSHSRELAGRLIRDDPNASLRQIAARTGLAPATVADVRARIRRGESPVPVRKNHADPARGNGGAATVPHEPGTAGHRPRRAVSPVEVLRIVDSLRRDPSLRFSESGRSVLRVLEACAQVARDRRGIADSVPAHCKGSLAQLAHGYAGLWQMLADDLENGPAGAADDGQVTSVGA
ncbi:transcriptional regulator [Streptomyces sp. NPDC091280]|uniref:ParB/RepB/Spo0J family partition protein n=1 Tax=Streptomyces sp. NPDC091280 TaxID=3365984 RepID=UPI0037FF82D1